LEPGLPDGKKHAKRSIRAKYLRILERSPRGSRGLRANGVDLLDRLDHQEQVKRQRALAFLAKQASSLCIRLFAGSAERRLSASPQVPSSAPS